jgi:hypothetical protein
MKSINTAGQALHPPDHFTSGQAFLGKPRGIEPFISSLAQPCPYKYGHGFASFVNKKGNS